MIFLTLGTQLPFDRLVKALDDVASSVGEEVFGQIGDGKYKPKSYNYASQLAPNDYNENIRRARVIVGHAGIGTILSALKYEKPLIVMARRANLGEHRNDHQLATLSQVKEMVGVYVAEDAVDLMGHLKNVNLQCMRSSEIRVREDLIESLRKSLFC